MTIKRGKRRSLVLETGRWRFRLSLGRYRFGYEQKRHDDARFGVIACPLCLFQFQQTAPRLKPVAHPGHSLVEVGAFIVLIAFALVLLFRYV